MRSFAELQSVSIRRRQERVLARLQVRYGIAEMDRDAPAQDISEGGLYILTNRIFKVGTRLNLMIEFPERPFHHVAEVAWAIQVPDHLAESLVHGMGVEFLEPDSTWPAFFRRWKRAALDVSPLEA